MNADDSECANVANRPRTARAEPKPVRDLSAYATLLPNGHGVMQRRERVSVTHHVAILWLDDPRCTAAVLVGSKAAHLSRLSAQHDVPPGFCLTSGRYDSDTDWNRLSPGLRDAMAGAYAALAERCGSGS